MAGEASRQKQAFLTIQAVTPLDHRRLHIEFGSGSILELNMENHLRAARYYDLNHDAVFHSASTDGEKIIFDTGTSFELEIFAREAIALAMNSLNGAKRVLRAQPLDRGQLRLELASGSVLILNMGAHPGARGRDSPDGFDGSMAVYTDGDNLMFDDVHIISQEELTRLVLTAPPQERSTTSPSKEGPANTNI